MPDIISVFMNLLYSLTYCASVFLTSKSVTSLAYCSSGNLLISGSEDGAIKVWDTRTNNIIRVLKHSKGTKPSKCYYLQNIFKVAAYFL